MRMKKALVVVSITVCAALALSIVLQAGAVKILQQQIAQRLPGARVSVTGTIRLRFSLRLWREPLLARIVLKNVLCKIEAPGRALAKIAPPSMQVPSGGYSPVGVIVLDRCRIVAHTADARCDAVVSGTYDLARKRLQRVDLSLPLFVYGALRLEGVEAALDRDRPSRVSVQSAVFDKLRARGVSAVIELRGNDLVVSQGTASVLGGSIGFDGVLPLPDPRGYQLRLQLKGMDVAVLVNDFKWQEKVRASGSLSGSVSVDPQPGTIGRISGLLQADDSGGTVNILDRAFLENIARWSKQPVELITESFRDYRYQAGVLTVDTQGRDLVLDASLSGPQGKRDLTIVLHE